MKTVLYTFILSLSCLTAYSQDPNYYEETNTEQGEFDPHKATEDVRAAQQTIQNMAMKESDALTESRMKRNLLPALQGFLNTEFMLKFYDLKKESEGLVAAFKAEQMDYHPRDVQEVKLAYEQVRKRFNQHLVNIKNDFKDKKKQKIIRDAPDMYANGLGFEMQQLKDFYDSVFRQTLADVRGNDLDGAIPVGLILSMIELVSEVTSYMVTSNHNTRRMTEEYLQQHLIQPYSLMAWDEIMASEGDSYKQRQDSQMYPQANNEYKDPFYSNDILPASDTTSVEGGRKKNN